MADEGSGRLKNLDISLAELQSLDPQVLKRIQDAHGIEVSVRSSAAAIDQILGSLRKDPGSAAEYTRGFDRTSDMYGKYFDRDTSNIADQLIRPGDLERIGRVTLEEALQKLTLDEIAKLKQRSVG